MQGNKTRDTTKDLLVIPNFINQEVVESLKEIYFLYPWRREKSYVSSGNDGNKYSNIRSGEFIRITPDEQEFSELFFNMEKRIREINDSQYQFDISGIHEDIKVISYKDGDRFDWHYDIVGISTSNRKINFSIQLSDSDEYEEGDLEFFLVDIKHNPATRKAGTLICYPSYLPHRASAVKSGQRLVLVGHVNGNAFR
jgi:hypothetical protein